MAESMKAPEIPFLQKDQRVKDWRKLYTAATSALKKEEQIAFLPLYVGRNGRDVEEQSIVSMCAEGKEELTQVLDEFEGLVDGAPSRMDIFNDVFELKPKSMDFAGLTNFFFKLMKEGVRAGLTYDLIFMRFLKFVKNGRKFYEEKKAEIISTLTAPQTITLFKAFQAKLIPSGVAPKIKAEPTDQEYDDYYAFQLENERTEKMPSWALDLQNNMKSLEARMVGNGGDQDGKSEVFWGQQNRRGHERGRGRRTNSSFRCYSCDGFGHYAAHCKTVCTNCKKVGHSESKCQEKKHQTQQHHGKNM